MSAPNQSISQSDADFQQTINSLPFSQQRLVGSKFIEKVLDLAEDQELAAVVRICGNPEASRAELDAAYQQARSIYVDSYPRELEALDFNEQAKHFVAEACMACAEPVDNNEGECHLAQKVAQYCRLAKTFSTLGHETPNPVIDEVEKVTQESLEQQHIIVEGYLGRH